MEYWKANISLNKERWNQEHRSIKAWGVQSWLSKPDCLSAGLVRTEEYWSVKDANYFD